MENLQRSGELHERRWLLRLGHGLRIGSVDDSLGARPSANRAKRRDIQRYNRNDDQLLALLLYPLEPAT